MRDSAIDAVGQTIRLGDRVAYVRGNRRVSINSYEVVGFTDASVRIGDYGQCVSPGRLVKMGDQDGDVVA